jgi:hypothetical protein
MKDSEPLKDLVVLVADKNMEFAIRGVLERPEALGIDKINFAIYPHPKRDPGCLNDGHVFLSSFVNEYKNALIVFDLEGCGKEKRGRKKLEKEMEERLEDAGWGNRAAAIVIDPELEIWVWSDSPEVDKALGWGKKSPGLRSWLKEEGFIEKSSLKPFPPKEAVENALKKSRIPRSSSIYKQIADNVSLSRCQDPAFLKLKEKLLHWFS